MSGELFEAPSVTEAWLKAADRIAVAGALPDFIAISAGAGFSEATSAAQLDAAAAAIHAERPTAVASVLFPRPAMQGGGDVNAKIARGWTLFGRGRRRGIRYSGWQHTYFERLTGSWMDRNLVRRDIKENRLRSIIEKINAWGKDAEAALYLHTDAPTDTLRPRGSPCLQYVQVRATEGDEIHLYALYRAHDYFHKALGNMIGLQRLGEFIAGETNRKFIRQTVFSLHPFSGASKTLLRNYADGVRQI